LIPAIAEGSVREPPTREVAHVALTFSDCDAAVFSTFAAAAPS
jgi:hypothetical protein